MFYQTQTARRPPKGTNNAVFVSSDLDIWPLHSNLSERGTSHVCPVNLAQIRSAVPEIFYTQTKRSKIAPKTELYTVHCVR